MRPDPISRSKVIAALALMTLLLASCGRTPSGISPEEGVDSGARSADASSAAAKASSVWAAGGIDLILVPEAEPWLLALATPLAGRLRVGDQVPYLLAVSTRPGKEVLPLVDRLAPRRSLLLAPAASPEVAAVLSGPPPEVCLTGSDPLMASLLVAKQFWGSSNVAVIAPWDDPAALILGSSLAAQLSVPLLIGTANDDEGLLQEGLDGLGVTDVLLATSDSGRPPAWASRLRQQVAVLELDELQARAIAALGPAKVRTVVVARVPDEAECAGATAWLAPYVGLARGGAVVLCRSPAAAEAETSVAQLIGQQKIRPRSVTILADYASIGTNTVKIVGPAERATIQPRSTVSAAAGRHSLEASSSTPAEKADDDDEGNPPYEVETEPCVPTSFGQVAAMSVGRIPFASLEEATALFAGGLMRPRLLAKQPPRMMMVANPNLEEPLPLCEVVGRATAEEYKNCRIRVDEFYRKPAGAPEVMTALKTAQLVIYQGHGYHDWLFRSPADAARPRPSQRSQQSAPDHRQARESSVAAAAESSARRPQEKPSKQPRGRRFDGPLEGLPVVVLQACRSLHEDVLQQVHELGGVALLGSSTPIHSGSGTAFARAFSNGLLYRGDTLGEAMRDAQNYLFCLQDLGDRRGHQEQAKVQRVALSFRLWGDPEVRVFAAPVAKPIRLPVSIAWDGPDRLKIHVPATRLPQQKADAYIAWLFPGGETAAMVQRAEHAATRLLSPVHFFRLPLPKDFLAAGYGTLRRPADASARAVFRVDPVGGFLYVLYFPNKESPQKTFTLQFMKAPSLGGVLDDGAASSSTVNGFRQAVPRWAWKLSQGFCKQWHTFSILLKSRRTLNPEPRTLDR